MSFLNILGWYMDDDDPLPITTPIINNIEGESLPLAPNPLLAIAVSVFVPQPRLVANFVCCSSMQPGYVGGFSTTLSKKFRTDAVIDKHYAV